METHKINIIWASRNAALVLAVHAKIMRSARGVIHSHTFLVPLQRLVHFKNLHPPPATPIPHLLVVITFYLIRCQRHLLSAHRSAPHTRTQFSAAERTPQHKIQRKMSNKNTAKRGRASLLRSTHVYPCNVLLSSSYICCCRCSIYEYTYYDMAAKARGLNFSSSKALKKQPLTKPS